MAVSIIDFGADPSGNTDSTQAILNALNSGSSHVIAPEGTYKIRSIDFSAWGIPAHGQKPYIFDASAATFVHDSASSDFSMVSIFPGENNHLIRCTFKFGYLLGSPNVQSVLFIRYCNNCKIEVAHIGLAPNAVGVFCNQTNPITWGTFGNFIDIQDITGCRDGIIIYTDHYLANSEGFEGNIVKIGRLGFCTGDGIASGLVADNRTIFNSFFVGAIEHIENGYAIFERGGGNQYYINNLNFNGHGISAAPGLQKRSLFMVSNEPIPDITPPQIPVDPIVIQEHFYTNVYQKTTNF
jgi:hypothetical protein